MLASLRPVLTQAALLVPPIRNLYRSRAALARRVEDLEIELVGRTSRRVPLATARKPNLLIVSLPKSGTVYINTLLLRSLGLEQACFCNGYFPRDMLSLDRLQHYATRGGTIASTHLDPSATNLQLLASFIPRWIVHIRDPRAALLSWVHHVRRYHQEGEAFSLLRITPKPPEAILAGELGGCIDWHIDHLYGAMVDWIEAWLDAARGAPDHILVTEYASLLFDEEALCRKMAGFAGCDLSAYAHRPPAKTMDVHFRNGELNEWQRGFTRDQIERTSAMIRPALAASFGWELGSGSVVPLRKRPRVLS